MSRQISIQDSITVNPSGNTGSSNLTSSNITNGYADSSSTTYATLTLSSGSTGYIYFTFDTSAIPTGATIDSITGTVKVRISSTSRVTSTVCQLYSGTTAKGSSYTFASTSTSNTVSITSGGSWTLAELADLRLRIGGTGSSSGGGGGGSTTRAIYFYGADIVINYSLDTTAYTVAASSYVTGVTASPAAQEVYEGESAEIIIDAADIDDIAVTDNDVDVTSSLVQHAYSTSGTLSQTATSVITGFSGGSSMDFYTSSSSTGHNFNYAVGNTAEAPGSTASGSGSWTYVKENSGSTSNTGYGDFSFDFSAIPEGATITSVEVRCYGAVEDSSQSTSHAEISLYSGSTQKGTTQSFTSSTNNIVTISSPGTWTRAELQEAKLRFTVGYYGGHIFGITWVVSYTYEPENPYYWTYSLSNIDDDHIILIDQAGAYIPPDEDPDETYWPITVSSINATTDPNNGTTRVIEGTNKTITIYPSDPQLTLALDNGVDITADLVGNIPVNTYQVTGTVSGASYGFTETTVSGTDWMMSSNAGQASSAAVCRLNLTFETECLMTLQYINYAEATYDYGIFGQIDTALGTTYTADSGAYKSCSTSSDNSSSVQTLTYTVSAGSHFIDIKYRKDTSQDSNNDCLYWRVESIEPTSAVSSSYTYTLTNIAEKHSLVFVFGNVSYYFITSSGSNCRLFPDGQQVKLQGGSYRLNIVPNALTDTVSITDNGTDVTSSLVREDGTDKDDNPVVSYTYQLSNIQAAHNLLVMSISLTQVLYLNDSGSWIEVNSIYRKENGAWVEKSITYLSDENIRNLIKG